MKVEINGFQCSVSMGNSKLGRTMNWSLLPGVTCSAEACRTCLKGGCYAASIVRRRHNVRAAWETNTRAMLKSAHEDNWIDFQSEIVALVWKKQPKYFRVHVGGDFFCRNYFRAWVRIAKACPDTRFFAFTKQWDNVKGIELPENFTLIASHWTGCQIPKWALARLPVAWLVEKGQPVPTRNGKPTYICPGDCTNCHWCNHLTREIGDVAFPKHR